MIFSSVGFVFLFLPVVFSIYFCMQNRGLHFGAKIFLVCASFVFYAIGSPSFVLIFFASVVFNFCAGKKLALMQISSRKKFLLAAGILFNVILLGYYKYTDFFIQNANFVLHTNFPLKNIALPVGISFFTFQLIAYLFDSYQGLTSSYKFVDYLLFISFFPQLIVGPIVHHGEMVCQFESEKK